MQVPDYARRCPYCTSHYEEPIGVQGGETLSPFQEALGEAAAAFLSGLATWPLSLVSGLILNMIKGPRFEKSILLTNDQMVWVVLVGPAVVACSYLLGKFRSDPILSELGNLAFLAGPIVGLLIQLTNAFIL